MNACPRCATVLLPGASVCSACGLMLGAAPAAPSAPPPPPPAPVAPPATPTAPPAAPPVAVPPPPPMPETRMQVGAPTSDNPERRRVLVLLAILAIVVIAGAAYYVIHHNSSNNGTPPASVVGAETLAPTTTPSNADIATKTSGTPQDEAVQSNLRALAVAEESYLTDYDKYTVQSNQLKHEGYPVVASITAFAGTDGTKGYCLIATAGQKGPFFVYDSARGGLQRAMFPSLGSAAKGCSDHAIKNYGLVG